MIVTKAPIRMIAGDININGCTAETQACKNEKDDGGLHDWR